jgi:LuxR family transcriptional regulator, regulator of acetate metabolism
VATIVPRPATQGRESGYGHDAVAPTDLAKVREALGRLRAVLDVREISERCVRELCQSLGFDRAVLFTVENDELVADAVHFNGDPDWAADFLAMARAARPRLDHMLLESEVVRRKRPLLVSDPTGDPRAFKPLVDASRTQSYIAAPVMPGGNVIAMLHVDRYTSGKAVTQEDVELVWTFAEGFGYAYERTRLLARLRRHAAELAEVGGMPFSAAPASPPPSLRSFKTVEPAAASDSEAETPLTAREREVMELVSTGSTNSEIATALVISESTVKSHVKHILRKLGAANRAEAVSRHLSMTDD